MGETTDRNSSEPTAPRRSERQALKISPSIVAADLWQLGHQVEEAIRGGADRLHIDVMDGRFVPTLSLGVPVVRALRQHCPLPLESHLMVQEPDSHLEAFAEAGSTYLIVHQETCPHLHRTLVRIRDLGCRPGVALNPATPWSTIGEVLDLVDLVLVMSVDPGFAGQQFLPRVLHKVSELADYRQRHGLNFDLEVDGGIQPHTAALARRAGADILVAATAIFASSVPIAEAVRHLRSCAQS
jgi:ribulose-phosphate 3-epimerase